MKAHRKSVAAAILAGVMVTSGGRPALGCGGMMSHSSSGHGAPEYKERVERLRVDLDANDAALAAAQDEDEEVRLLKRRAELQDELLAELTGEGGEHAQSGGGSHEH